MKIIEIILKLGFLADAIYLLITKDLTSLWLCIFVGISFLLGIVLFFNKKQSYGYELEKREIIMRKIEVVLLIVFSVVLYFLNVKP